MYLGLFCGVNELTIRSNEFEPRASTRIYKSEMPYFANALKHKVFVEIIRIYNP